MNISIWHILQNNLLLCGKSFLISFSEVVRLTSAKGRQAPLPFNSCGEEIIVNETGLHLPVTNFH